jgi:ABC-2 type transport system permease protein
VSAVPPARVPGAWRREAAFLARDRSVWAWWAVVLCLSALAVAGGLREVAHQRATLERLAQLDRAERQAVLSASRDLGGAAYGSFHLTFDPPSDFAFAALGRRDELPWKHRVRMLALEGQIHERDAGNPVLALVGRFDYAFLAAFVLPLVLILLLYDLQARERRAGRHEWLVATASDAVWLWRWRALLRMGGVFVAAAVPLTVGAAASGTGAWTLLATLALLAVYLLGWAVVALRLAAWRRSGELILSALLGLWLVLAVLVPAAGRVAIDRAVPLPSAADILMTQREAVNGAWDLPKAVTMNAFAERHPQWSDHLEVQRPFEWKWYYAFQQVGDQQAQALSEAYTAGRQERDRRAAALAWVAPPALLERALQRLAGTDLHAALAYEARVRAFHAELRAFHYPRLFLQAPFDAAALAELPAFEARAGGH